MSKRGQVTYIHAQVEKIYNPNTHTHTHRANKTESISNSNRREKKKTKKITTVNKKNLKIIKISKNPARKKTRWVEEK